MLDQIVKAGIIKFRPEGGYDQIGEIICTIGYLHNVVDSRYPGYYCNGYDVLTGGNG